MAIALYISVYLIVVICTSLQQSALFSVSGTPGLLVTMETIHTTEMCV